MEPPPPPLQVEIVVLFSHRKILTIHILEGFLRGFLTWGVFDMGILCPRTGKDYGKTMAFLLAPHPLGNHHSPPSAT